MQAISRIYNFLYIKFNMLQMSARLLEEPTALKLDFTCCHNQVKIFDSERALKMVARLCINSSQAEANSISQGSIMPTSIQLPQDVEKRLEDLARKTGRSKEAYITEAVLEYLDDLEDIYLAEQALERIRRGEERTYSLEEVERELGLGD